jgi:hypothetical protein
MRTRQRTGYRILAGPPSFRSTMATFTIKAVGHEGNIMEVATTVTATEALARFREAWGLYRRAWVISESREDIPEGDLVAMAAGERQ